MVKVAILIVILSQPIYCRLNFAAGLSSRLSRAKTEYSHKRAKSLEDATYLEPNPILKLQRVIGFGSGIGNEIPSLAYQ